MRLVVISLLILATLRVAGEDFDELTPALPSWYELEESQLKPMLLLRDKFNLDEKIDGRERVVEILEIPEGSKESASLLSLVRIAPTDIEASETFEFELRYSEDAKSSVVVRRQNVRRTMALSIIDCWSKMCRGARYANQQERRMNLYPEYHSCIVSSGRCGGWMTNVAHEGKLSAMVRIAQFARFWVISEGRDASALAKVESYLDALKARLPRK